MTRARKILVTGGAGFIGSNIVDRLVELGHKVVIVDDLSTGHLRNLNRAATFYHTSITSPGVEEVLQREEPEIVIHHAAQVNVRESVKDPAKDAETNILGSVRLIENARLQGVEKFIYASSGGAVYGDPQYLPCDEEHPVRPISPYGLSKHVTEQYLELYRRLYQMDYTILRYGNVYGPRQDPKGEAGVVAIFIQAMLEGKQPSIFGTGEQERDFVYVGDVVEANVLALEKGSGRVYNIGTGVGTSVNRIFDLLKGILKFPWRPVYHPAKPGEVFKIHLDISRAKNELGWQPKTSLEEGLEMTVEHMKKSLKTSPKAP